jgi:hypothetical protein
MLSNNISALAIALLAGACAAAPSDDRLGGLWSLRISNADHREVSVATIRFTDDPARSCMGGDWKGVVVESVTATDERFFPLSDPLSYSAGRSEITIGRNEICDGYLHLRGKLESGTVRGVYVSFGIEGGETLGDFTLIRMP